MYDNTSGLEINDQHTRVAQIKYEKNRINIQSLGFDNTAPNFFSNPSELVSKEQSIVISRLYSELRIKSKKVRVILPDSATYSQILVMPKLSQEELVRSIHLQADEFVPLPINEVYIDLEIIENLPNGKLLIMFVAAQKKIVDHVFTTISNSGLEPEVLENEVSVLGRFAAEVFRFTKEPALVLNFGYGGSAIYILNPPFPYFQLIRSTRIGYDIVLRDLKVNMNFDQTKALELTKSIGLRSGGSVNLYPVIYPIINELLLEIQKSVALTKEKYNKDIKNILIYNYDSHISGLKEIIQTKLSIPTTQFPIESVLVPNPITQSFKDQIPSFLSVIASNFR